MDPQMVWDMMEEETEADKHTALCQSLEPDADKETFKDTGQSKSSRGWMGFPVYGLNR
jgi:hypothetical protein